MTQLTLYDYLTQNRTPSKIIAVDVTTSYLRIPISMAYLPICASMIVDHVEIEPDCPFNDVVFVRCSDGLKVGDKPYGITYSTYHNF